MKTIILILLVTYSALITAQETKLFETINYQNAVKNGTRSRDGNPGPNYWQNHSDYDISVRLDTAGKRIFGNQTVIYHNESPDTLNRIVLRLYQNRYQKGTTRNVKVRAENLHDGIVIDSLIINWEKVSIPGNEFNRTAIIPDSTSGYNGTNLCIWLDEKMLPGESLELKCSWNHKIPTGNSFRRHGHYKDDAWFIGYFYPQIAVYDDMEYLFGVKGWDYELFYQGFQEFYNDFNNYKVRIEVPPGFFVWATGDLMNPKEVYNEVLFNRMKEAESSDSITKLIARDKLNEDHLIGNIWYFEAKGVPDFAFGTAKGYLWDASSIKLTDKRVSVHTAYHPDSDLFDMVIEMAKTSIDLTSNFYPGIDYPWNKITIFNGMHQGGMEYPMIANNMYIPDTLLTFLVTFHEIFHNYTPFMMGFNEKKYVFMDEGLTHHFTNHALLRTMNRLYIFAPRGESPADDYRFFVLNGDVPLINSYAHARFTNLQYLSFVKPETAYTLFRDMVGEEKFLFAFKEFVNRWKGKHPTPWDMFYTFNNVLEENYNWFWKAWFFDQGYPDLGVRLDGNHIVVECKGVGSLPLPVKLYLEMADGSAKTIERSMDVWKGGERKINIEYNDLDNVKVIRLDTASVPDIDHTNNYVEVN